MEDIDDPVMPYATVWTIFKRIGFKDELMLRRMQNIDRAERDELLSRMLSEPVTVLDEYRRMQKIIAIMYQFAGDDEEIPALILDVLSQAAKAKDEDIEAMLMQEA